MSKLKYLLQHWPNGTVAVEPWLNSIGVYKELKRSYKKHAWVDSIGRGAIVKPNEKVDWKGGLYAVQKQLHLPIYVGGKTALELKGISHFARFSEVKIFLYSPTEKHLPKWYINHDWGAELLLISSKFLPPDVGITTEIFGDFELELSTPERAFLELLYLVPKYQTIEEAYLIAQSLVGLRPLIMQKLLNYSTSVKVNRLALFFGDYLNQPWFKQINISNIDLGSGVRNFFSKGHYNAKYKITLPKEIYQHEGQSLQNPS